MILSDSPADENGVSGGFHRERGEGICANVAQVHSPCENKNLREKGVSLECNALVNPHLVVCSSG